MPILTRYLLRAHVGPLLFAFVALTGVVLINTLARSMADLAGKGLPVGVFVEFFVLSLPANIALTLPMSVLVAVLYVFSQMAAENEITALRASGVDLRRMVLPLIAAGALIAGGMVWFNDQVLPAANHRWRVLMMDVAQTSPLLSLRPRVVNEIPAGDGAGRYYLQAAEVDHASNRMRDVTIHDVSAPEISRTIYADSARMHVTEGATGLLLVLHDGEVREVQRGEPESFRQMRFQEQVLRMTGIRQALDRSDGAGGRSDREMSTAMMGARIDTLRTDLAALRQTGQQGAVQDTGSTAGPRSLAAGLPDGGEQAELLRFRIRELQVEIHKKLAIATAALVFVLVGAPLALRFPRGGVGMVIAASLTIFAVYYVGLIGGEALGNGGYVPPWIAMWITNAGFGAMGLIGFWKLGGERTTGRGGSAWALPARIVASLRERRPARAMEV